MRRIRQLGAVSLYVIVMVLPACGSDGTGGPDAAVDTLLPDQGTEVDQRTDSADLGGDASCGEAGCGECTTNDDCADRASRTICDVERRQCVACVEATDCEEGYVCERQLCILECGAGDSCPDGFYCSGADNDKQCLEKECTQSSDCTETERPHCDTSSFLCTEAPLPQVKPTLSFFRASPPVVPLGTASSVVFSFAFDNIPSPVPTCTVNGNAVVLAEEGKHLYKAMVTVSNALLPSSYTLECKSPAGDVTATALVAGMVPFTFNGTLTPAGSTLSMGPYSFVVPPGAVHQDTDITVKIAPAAAESASLMGVVASFEPHGLHMRKPITLTVPYDETLMAAAGWGTDTAKMVIGSSQGTMWRRLKTTIDPVAKTLTGRLQHFSEYVPMDGSKEEGWHPLAAGSNGVDTDLVRQEELVLLRGPTSGTNNRGTVFDDAKHGGYLEPVPVFADEDGTHRVDQAIFADVDDDGRDELIYTMFYKRSEQDLKAKYGVKIKVMKYVDGDEDNQIPPKMELLFTVDSGDIYSNVSSIYNVDVKAGQLDGEGAEELVIAVSTCKYHDARRTWHEAIRYKRDSGAYVIRYDSEEAKKYKVVKNDFGLAGVWDVSVAVGDLDGEGRDNIVVAGRATINSSRFYDENYRRMKVWVYEDEQGGFELKKTLYKAAGSTLLNGTSRVTHPRVAVAPLDDDKKREIIIAGIVDHLQAYRELFNDSSSDYALINSQKVYSVAEGQRRLEDLRLTAANTVRDDFWEPVVAVYETPDRDGSSPLWRVFHAPHGEGASPFASSPSEVAVFHVQSEPQGMRLAYGDMDRDGKDELYIAYRVQGMTHAHVVAKYAADDSNGSYEVKFVRNWNKGGNEEASVIAVGDIDGDNVRVRYTGERTTAITADPLISLVMLTPPTKSGINQDHSASSTTYGENTTTSASATNSIGIKTTATVSYKGGTPFRAVEVEAFASFSYAFTRTETTTNSEGYGLYENVGYDIAGGGSVIFVSQTYDSYKYEVLAHSDPDRKPEDPDNQFISIDVPEYDTKVERYSIEYFNANNGDGADIGAETFTHVNGDPSTYPTAQEKDDLLASGGWENGPVPVGEGNDGKRMLTITVGESTTTGDSHSIGVTLGGGITIAKTWGFKGSVGTTSSWAYKVTCGKSVVYRGSVGDISGAAPDNDYSRYKYDFGLFIYDHARDDDTGIKYQVVNYWVENYNP